MIFSLGLFLVSGKRKSKLIFLGKQAEEHKASYKFYNTAFFDYLLIISFGALFF